MEGSSQKIQVQEEDLDYNYNYLEDHSSLEEKFQAARTIISSPLASRSVLAKPGGPGEVDIELQRRIELH